MVAEVEAAPEVEEEQVYGVLPASSTAYVYGGCQRVEEARRALALQVALYLGASSRTVLSLASKIETYLLGEEAEPHLKQVKEN